MRGYRSYNEYSRSSAIAPVGSVSPKSGKCLYFNIYEVWAGSTVEIYKDRDGKLRFVSTSGESYMFVGEHRSFRSDQGHRELGEWTLVDKMKIEDLKTSKYLRSAMYCYK